MFDIQAELKKLPQRSGVYIMRDEDDTVIYVGKAINLRNRVRSYFQAGNADDPKIRGIRFYIRAFEYIVTDTEVEALILENNLIKRHMPRFNVLLKDDKIINPLATSQAAVALGDWKNAFKDDTTTTSVWYKIYLDSLEVFG
jgi:excinuclease UvrABC nuclease subunit